MKYQQDVDEDRKVTLEEEALPEPAADPVQGQETSNSPDTENTEGSAHPVPDLGSEFEVLEFIGSGGMSSVYKARNVTNESIVAIKILSGVLAKDRSALKRFENESQSLIELNDPELLTMLGAGVTDAGMPYLVMEYIEGESLADILNHGRIEIPRALDLIIDTCRALSHAHKRGIVHRDIKPSNILVTRLMPETESEKYNCRDSERVRIVDFGIARIVESTTGNTTSLTQTGAIFGTPTYMSPEQCKPNEPVDQRADIYGIGCLLYELIMGKPPFEGDNPIQIAIQHLNDQPATFPKSLKDKTAKRLESIVLKCLEKDPLDRFQTVDELLKKLVLVKEGRGFAALGTPFRRKQKKIPTVNGLAEGISIFLWVYAMLFLFMSWSQPCTTPTSISAQDMGDFFYGFFLWAISPALILMPLTVRRDIKMLRSSRVQSVRAFEVIFDFTFVAQLISGFTFIGLHFCQFLKGTPLLVPILPIAGICFLVTTLVVGLIMITSFVFEYPRRWFGGKPLTSFKRAFFQIGIVFVLISSSLTVSVFAAPGIPARLINSVTGMFYYDKETNFLARALWETSLRLDPHNVDAVVATVNMDFLHKDYSRALADLKENLPANPDNEKLKFLLATTYNKLDDYQAAVKEYEMLFADLDRKEAKEAANITASSLITTLRNDSVLSYSSLLIKLHRFEEATDRLTQLIRSAPRDENAYRLRGSVYAAQRDYSRATDDYYKALLCDYDNLDYLRLGLLYELQGDTDNAKNNFTLCATTYSGGTASAIAFMKLNEPAKAKQAMQDCYTPKKSLDEISKELFDPDLKIPIKLPKLPKLDSTDK